MTNLEIAIKLANELDNSVIANKVLGIYSALKHIYNNDNMSYLSKMTGINNMIIRLLYTESRINYDFNYYKN